MTSGKAQFAILGNPDHRRVTLFQDALARLGLPPADILSYADLLAGRAPLARWLDAREPTESSILRIESPGGDFPVARELLALGAREPEARLTAAAALASPYERGRILYPAQLFAGYRRLLAGVSEAIAGAGPADRASSIRLMNAPAAIVSLFDKAECRALLEAGGVRMTPGLGQISSYEQLRQRMREQRAERVFVKLRHGSSASGVVAYRAGPAGERAVTSTVMALDRGQLRLFNSLKLRDYRRSRDIERLIDALAAEGVEVERWVDKARLGDDCFDVRIVVIAGRARHAVVRCSTSPMTNLHLGNRRGPLPAMIELVGEERWRQARELAEAAVACVPGAFYAGVDVLFDARDHRPHVVEANAFGDLLPGLLERGDDTYTAEIRACWGETS